MSQEEEEIVFEDNELESESESDEGGIPPASRKLLTQAYDKSVTDVMRMIGEKEINLNPHYQREYLWDNRRASLLVESILLNVPIPVIYVAQEENDVWNVIDGLQRLHSLKRFFDGEFKLRGLDVLSELNGSDISSLTPKHQRMLKNGLLRVIVISNDSNPEIKYDIFMRLNRGSVKLSEQELRNCLYRGKLNNLLMQLRANTQLREILNLKTFHKRMIEAELALRFLALSSDWDSEKQILRTYKNKFKRFLNAFMENNKNPHDEALQQMRDSYENTLDKAYAVFGENSFRRVDAKRNFEKTVNRGLMDCVMVTFALFSKDDLVAKREPIISRLAAELKSNSAFKNAMTTSTSDKPQVEARIGIWQRALGEVMQADG
ncbi:MAG: DUF262 domain-containing protein [Leptospirales bacterium]|nr:DUF262 domain-containing protein [Leptospirales bacterium]